MSKFNLFLGSFEKVEDIKGKSNLVDREVKVKYLKKLTVSILVIQTTFPFIKMYIVAEKTVV